VQTEHAPIPRQGRFLIPASIDLGLKMMHCKQAIGIKEIRKENGGRVTLKELSPTTRPWRELQTRASKAMVRRSC